jgi:hypothetical protein
VSEAFKLRQAITVTSTFHFPAMAASYDNLNSQNHNVYSNTRYGDSGYITPATRTKRTSNWIKVRSKIPHLLLHSIFPQFGIPLLILVIAGAVVGGVLGSRKKGSSSSSASSSAASAASASAAASSAASAKSALGRFATATNSEFLMPIYPSTTDSAAFGSPTFVSTTDSNTAWPTDPFQPSTPDVLKVRTDRPRLIAPAYKWAALPKLIANDPYLQGWNATIFGNATQYKALPPVLYFNDGSSGILDNARDVKRRIKAFSYAYRMTNDSSWVDRTWEELQVRINP